MYKSKMILIVEDDMFSGMMLCRQLEDEGYECMHAAGVNEALDTLKQKTPDLILSDYEMPGKNGFDFREQLIHDPVLKNIPFIFFTSHTNETMMLKGLSMNAIDYISKETAFPVLLSKIKTVLQSVQNQQELSLEELRKAAEAINIKSIPQKNPEINGYSVMFWNKSYKNYPGGDFIDFIKADTDYHFIILGDVMGKKWKAWFFTFGYLSYIRAVIRSCVLNGEHSPAIILEKINQLICMDEALEDVFSSLSLVMLNNKTGNLIYSGAGDLPLLYFNKAANKTSRIQSAGLLLGFDKNADFNEHILQLNEGDQLLLFTDGLTDLANQNGERSNYDIFEQRISALVGNKASFDNIKKLVLDTINDDNQTDDASIIFIQKL